MLKLFILNLLFCGLYAQLRREARWCVMNENEMEKCQRARNAITERSKLSSEYPPDFKPYTELAELICVQGLTRFDCMEKVSSGQADLIQLDPGLGYTAGEYFTMMPLMAEKYQSGADVGLNYKAVAVVRKNTGFTINQLAGKKACHTGVGWAAGWVYPVSTLINKKIMPITECNVPVKSAASFFGSMCAPGGLAKFYNPFGNNPATVCENCKGQSSTYCMGNDPYAGYDGAFKCMASGDGDVAFVRDLTIQQATQQPQNSTIPPQYNINDFELLCPDNTRRPATQSSTCNWGTIPSHIVMTSVFRDQSLRDEYKMLMELLSLDFGPSGTYKHLFEIFDSSQFDRDNIMFSDATKELVSVGSKDSYSLWVGPEYRQRLQLLNTCPINQVRWCVLSQQEMTKCENMIMAFSAKNLKPDLNCILGSTARECMNMIRIGDADMIALDAADVYVAGRVYDLVPIAAEDYSGYNEAKYYAVTVARKVDSRLTVFNLKQKRSCHSGVMTGAGWVVPVDKLIETGQIRVRSCNPYFSVGQFFSKSCAPGVLNYDYNTWGTNPINMCEACASGGYDRCARNDNELYYGNSGAFRCLVESGGDVAFVKHTTVRENTDGRNQAEWSRNRRSDDYELMCSDGTRKDIDQWAECNMGSVPANAIVTASFKSQQVRNIYWTLLNYAQQFFASDSNPDFQMFSSSVLDHKDLIFQDSTVRLTKIPQDKQNYLKYLGPQFVRSMERLREIDCVTASLSVSLHCLSKSLQITVIISFLAIIFSR